jgi:hypothetical protein
VIPGHAYPHRRLEFGDKIIGLGVLVEPVISRSAPALRNTVGFNVVSTKRVLITFATLQVADLRCGLVNRGDPASTWPPPASNDRPARSTRRVAADRRKRGTATS